MVTSQAVGVKRSDIRRGMWSPVVWFVSNIFLWVVLGLTGNINAWGLVLLIWFNMFIFAALKITERSFFAAFLGSFFIFLMTMDTFERVFHFKEISTAESAQGKIATILIVCLAGLMAGYVVGRLPGRIRSKKKELDPLRAQIAEENFRVARVAKAERVRSAARLVFFLSLPGAFAEMFRTIMFTRGASYTGTYTETFVQQRSDPLSLFLQYSSEFASVAFVVYLATLPSWKSARVSVVLWFGYMGLFLFSGRRRDLAVLLLFFCCYAILRSRVTPDDPWLNKKRILAGIIGVPALLVVFAGVEAWRGLGSTRGGFSLTAVPDFLYGQGVSIKVIENVVTYGYLLPPQSYLLEFAQTGFIPRLLGHQVLQGNSIARALDGGSLSHSLSYVVLGPNRYLSGVSTGTSFVAEAYVTYAMVGVFGIGLLYGLLLAWLDRFGTRGLSMDILRLLVAQSLLWAPRGSSTGFLSVLVAPSTIAAVGAILLLALIQGALSRSKTSRRPVYRGGHGAAQWPKESARRW